MLFKKNLIFQHNYMRNEKRLSKKIVNRKKIYKFCENYFSMRRIVLMLIVKNNIKNYNLQLNYARCNKTFMNKIVHLRKVYKFLPEHFLIRCIVFMEIMKMKLKIKNLNC